MSNDLIFKYGTGDLPGSNAGTVYIKKLGNTKADMYVDSPEANSQRLRIGSDVYVGDPEDAEAEDYKVVINPNGEVIENLVTTETNGGFVIRVESVNKNNIDNWTPTDTPSKNTIIFVVEE